MKSSHYTIAIDGPVGAGKSTVAQAVAERLGILHLDTGAMYRALGLFVLDREIDPRAEADVVRCLSEAEVTVVMDGASQQTMLNGRDVSHLIRTEAVSMAASIVSRYEAVRTQMVTWQRQLAGEMSMVVDGRDIGTVVLPDADLKVFLTASPEVRAKRRYDQLVDKGIQANYQSVLSDLLQRDQQDMNRPIAPLKPAPDSRILDASDLTFLQVVETILQWAKELANG